MDEQVRSSRARISRRRALSLSGTVGLGGVLAACGVGSSGSSGTSGSDTAAAATTTVAPVGDTATISTDVVALLDSAKTCTLTKEETQGPYWFDVDSLRSDLREDRPGTTLTLAVRVNDITGCTSDQLGTPLASSVVEIWHCDAGGVYSGFESSSLGANGAAPGGGQPPGGGEMPSGGQPPAGGGGEMPGGGGEMPGGGGAPGGAGAAGSGETSNGSYSVGDSEAAHSDDATYLRGAQVADAGGIVQFTTIFPGWYRGRTVHIHLKVHKDKATVLTTQLFFDDALCDTVFGVAPYSSHTGRDTYNGTDSIYDASGLLHVQQQGDGYLAYLNLGVDV